MLAEIALYILIHMALGLAVHEFGHYAFGTLTGYGFLSFRLGPLVWFKEDGQVHFKFSKNNMLAGQCLMEPTKNPKEFKFVLYNLGGVLFNLFAVVIFLIIPGFHMFIVQGIVMNLCLAAANLVPMKRVIPNDGANVLEALKSKDAARGLYMMLYTNNETAKGKRFRDFDNEMFNVEEGADLSNYFVIYLVILEAARLEDLGKYNESFDLYLKIDLQKLPSYYATMIKADLMYHYICHKADFNKAREIFKHKGLQKLLKAGLPQLDMILSAYHFLVDGNMHEGKKMLDKARKGTENLPNKGQRLAISDHIKKLESLLQEKGIDYAA